MQDRRRRRGELERVAIAAGDQGVPAPSRLQGGTGREKIVGLVTRRLGCGEPARRDELRQQFELVDQLGVKLPPALVVGKQKLPVGRGAERIPADEHRARPLAVIEAHEEIGEADDRAAAAIAGAADRFRQRVIRAVRERVAVDHEQRAGCAVHRLTLAGLTLAGLTLARHHSMSPPGPWPGSVAVPDGYWATLPAGRPRATTMSDWSKVTRPIPVPNEWTRPFWDAAKRAALELQRCQSCGHFQHPPYATCTQCVSTDLKFEAVRGEGAIYAYTIMYHTGDKRFASAVPYASIIVELDDAPGALMAGNLLDAEYTEAKVGRRVEVVFEKLNDDITLPQFRLAATK